MRKAYQLVASCYLLATPTLTYAQVSELTDEDRARWEAAAEFERERHRAFELECEEDSPSINDEELELLEKGAVTDQSAFDCEADWIETEQLLQPLLPLIGEQGYEDYKEPPGSSATIAIRDVTIAYQSVSVVRTVECHFVDGENPREQVSIGGTARKFQMGKRLGEDDIRWELELGAADCDFLLETMKFYEPDDIIHKLPFDYTPSSNEIFLVHGRGLTEFLDKYGWYIVTLRPGIHGSADAISERTEAVLRTMADLFANRAEREGRKTTVDLSSLYGAAGGSEN